jgi:hypothetical protein
LTVEKLDFVVNYHIKYRLGLPAEAGRAAGEED